MTSPLETSRHLKRIGTAAEVPPTSLMAAEVHSSKAAHPRRYSVLQQAASLAIPSNTSPSRQHHRTASLLMLRQMREVHILSPLPHHCVLQFHVLLCSMVADNCCSVILLPNHLILCNYNPYSLIEFHAFNVFDLLPLPNILNFTDLYR